MPEDFDAVVAVVRAWHNGAVELELRGVGGRKDGRCRIERYAPGEASDLLVKLARLMAVRS